MPNREKVINGLEREIARTDLEWLDCVEVKLLQDAIALLKAQEPIEARLNLCESCTKEYAECEADKTDLVYGSGVGNNNVIGCSWYANRWKAQEPCEDAVSKQTVISALESEYSDWNDDYNVPITHCIKAVQSLPSVQPAPLARVMTLDELVMWQKQLVIERDPIYVEYRKGKGFGAPHWAMDNFGFNVATCQDNYKSGVYGMLVRCWTSRPTDKQREAIPWE